MLAMSYQTKKPYNFSILHPYNNSLYQIFTEFNFYFSKTNVIISIN